MITNCKYESVRCCPFLNVNLGYDIQHNIQLDIAFLFIFLTLCWNKKLVSNLQAWLWHQGLLRDIDVTHEECIQVLYQYVQYHGILTCTPYIFYLPYFLIMLCNKGKTKMTGMGIPEKIALKKTCHTKYLLQKPPSCVFPSWCFIY
jgi:hypothetical protein